MGSVPTCLWIYGARSPSSCKRPGPFGTGSKIPWAFRGSDPHLAKNDRGRSAPVLTWLGTFRARNSSILIRGGSIRNWVHFPRVFLGSGRSNWTHEDLYYRAGRQVEAQQPLFGHMAKCLPMASHAVPTDEPQTTKRPFV